MPRVLHVYKTYYPATQGGVEQFIYQLARTTTSLGYKHDILAFHDGRESEKLVRAEATVWFYPSLLNKLSTPMGFSYAAAYREMVKDVDIIHYHFPYPFADLLHKLCKINKPSLVTYHSDIVKQKFTKKLYGPLMERFLNSVDRIVATSENYKCSSHVLAKFSRKTDVIPLGIAEESFPKPVDSVKSEWRSRVGEDFFFFIGALRYYKGLEFLLQAAEDTKLPVVIAGVGRHGDELKARYSHLNNVSWLGSIDDQSKVALMELSRAFVFPSHLRSEAFGVGLLEAAMCGKPMISTELSTGTSFVNLHGETGIVVPPADSKALGQAMRKLSGDDLLIQEFGCSARKRYEKMFTARQMGDSYSHLYKSLLCSQ